MGAVSSESLGHPADFFTTKIWTPAGLVTFYVLFAIQLKTRRVHISIPTPNPDRVFMKQVALDLAALVKRFKLDELGKSIATTGYIPNDPLIGYRRNKDVFVREGNRRADRELLVTPFGTTGEVDPVLCQNSALLK